jgi:hypothetical protein
VLAGALTIISMGRGDVNPQGWLTGDQAWAECSSSASGLSGVRAAFLGAWESGAATPL